MFNTYLPISIILIEISYLFTLRFLLFYSFFFLFQNTLLSNPWLGFFPVFSSLFWFVCVFFFFFSCDGSHFVFFFNGSDMPHQPLKLTLSVRSSHMKCFLHLQFFFLHPFKLREHLFWNLVFLECKFLHSGLGGRSNLWGGRSKCHIIAQRKPNN